jgi:TPR repeat protein
MFALGGRVPFSWKWASRYQARACDLGSAQMCYRAGFQLKNPERRPDEARGFFVRACDMKYMAGCEELALMETDVAKHLLLLRSACDMGSAKSCAELGQRAATGDGVPLDAGEALGSLDRACDAGNGDMPACEAFWPLALESRDSKRISRGLRGLHAGFMTGEIPGAFEKLEAARKDLQERCERHETYACEALK